MDIYVALRDEPGRKSALIGAFSRENEARDACQQDADEDAVEGLHGGGSGPTPLIWLDTEAALPDGSTYVVVLTDLDARTGY